MKRKVWQDRVRVMVTNEGNGVVGAHFYAPRNLWPGWLSGLIAEGKDVEVTIRPLRKPAPRSRRAK